MKSISPVEKRRSRKIAPADIIDEEIAAEDLLNLEDERLRSRQQAENESENLASSDKRLSVSEKSISEHFQSCIRLAAENKINSKNAFSFKLIDLLHSMLSKKKSIKDFTEVSSSLDAGVKIYSCRVDNVHADTLKMATTVCLSNKTRKENVEDGNQGMGRDGAKKKGTIRKTKKTTIASTKDIDRPTVNDNGSCPYSILTNENLVTSRAIFDCSEICWHLNTSQNFWQNEKPVRYRNENTSVDLPITLLDVPNDVFISSTFKNFHFGEESTLDNLSMNGKTFPASEINFEPNNDEISDDDFAIENANDDDASQVPHRKSAGPQNHVECLSKMMSSSDFIMEISNLITSEKSDYRYFSFQQLQKKINSRNTRHWAPLRKKTVGEQKRSKEEKKTPINFESKNDDDLEVFERKNYPTCILNTFAPREKFLITPVTDFSVKKFFKLNVWWDMFVIPNVNNSDEGPSELEEMIEDYNYDNPNDTQNFLSEHCEDDYCDEQENDVMGDVHEVVEKTTLNLVEIPSKVSKIQLPYMVKDKSVNMKDLKLKIWRQIEPAKKMENENASEPITFVSICDKIMLGDDDLKKDLSIPIMFNAILQLANDKNLALFNSEGDGTDFFVSVDTTNTFLNGS